jgi:hypothetical protein
LKQPFVEEIEGGIPGKVLLGPGALANAPHTEQKEALLRRFQEPRI